MKKTIFILFLLLILLTVVVSAAETNDVEENILLVGSTGIEVDNIVTLVASIMALALFGLTFMSYKRDGRKRFLYVAVAFLLFAVKGLMIATDIFYPQKPGWMDLVASVLDFGILLSFFIGLLKK